MHQNLFFESIDQPVCIISKGKSYDISSNDFLFEFNSAFKSVFPKISHSNILEEFNHEFNKNTLAFFAQKKTSKDFLFEYQNNKYNVFIEQVSIEHLAFLFKEENVSMKNNHEPKSESEISGIYSGMRFSVNSFEDAPLMVVITDTNGRIEYVNKKFTELTGYTEKEALGKNPNVLKSGKQSKAFYKQLWETVLSGKIWNNSFHNRKKSGQLYWQETHMIPLMNDAGKVTRILALGEDITESKAIETIVEEKSDLLFQMVEHNPDIVCVKDGEGRWLLANSAELKLFGLEDLSYYGKTSAELAEYVPFYREVMKLCMDTDELAWQAGKLNRLEETIPMVDGRKIILDTIKIPSFNADGTRKYLIVLGRDVSILKKTLEDLKRIDKRYALAQKASGIASWEWDIETLTLSWAENLEQVFGSDQMFENREFKNVLVIIHPEDRFVFFHTLLKAVHNLDEYNFEVRIYDIDQNLKWVEMTGRVHFDELKRKSILLGIVYDITERKNYVKDIIQARQKAEESDRLKSSFLATMSHELRTPLNAVIGFSDLILGDSDLDPELDEFVHLINNNGLHLLSLIEDIFDLSLMESNQIKIYNDKFELIQGLQDLTEMIPIEIEKFNKEDDIVFINELPDKQIFLDSDASRVNQIVGNLLKNAIKFTPKGYVKLGVREVDEDVIIYVEDNGIGISKEKQNIIFEIFRQGEESLTRQFGGAGLGLSLSHNLSELLGGKLWVDSDENTGAVFSFKIKRLRNGHDTINEKSITVETIDWSNKYVLIAEDEFSNFELLLYILKPTKVRIKQVTNGNDAIFEALSVERPDLILMDIKMPDLNGFEATKIIKEVYPDLPIIAQTAFAISGDRELALEMGCDEYISKPLKKIDLLKLMKNYLG